MSTDYHIYYSTRCEFFLPKLPQISKSVLSIPLTHLNVIEFPSLINWTSPFTFLGLLGCISHFYSNFNGTPWEETLLTIIRRYILQHQIWVCTVCLCPTKRVHGLYGLILTIQNPADQDPHCFSLCANSCKFCYLIG